ncbi:sulfatase [Streptomyces sp. WI04-05B]|uniref:sulfatase n=1 Tax=Streptomyces TaxID=1883 RepID=UPI0029AFFBC3|nr:MULTISPECIES: sulfatase [unclassified Streptomyces]MDX2541631.1 sulfatase [Streptomyces sp. WI04-05B]MDX2583635.1 sulfatase [Streptomyces sp. WI04-05A]MDX3745420.1 sulfatase [Streptomyces sp. AK08-02]
MSHHTPPRQLPETDADAPDGTTAEEASRAPAVNDTDPGASTDTEPTGRETTGSTTAAEADETDARPEPEEKSADGAEDGKAPDETLTSRPVSATDESPDAAASDPSSTDEPGPSSAASSSARPGWFGWRSRFPRAARAVRVGTSVLAGVFVLAVLLIPNRLDRMSAGSFLRLPVEAIFLAAVLLVLPSKARRITAVVLGAFLGLSTVLKCLDMGFYQTLARPFDLVFDWVLLNDAADFLKDSLGRSGEVLAVIGVIVLLIAVLAVSALAVVRLADVMARHRPAAVRGTLVLGTAWVVCFTMGVQTGGVTIATKGYSQYLSNKVQYVREGLGDAEVFDKQLRVDAFADTPSDQLLTGLRGKDVLFTFVESYGRVAIDDPSMAPEMDATLKQGDARLKSAGFAARSGWLTSPVTGAGSWLAHTTFLSGLWIKNQQRYRTVTTSDRATLTSYFQKTGAWRTVGIVPGVRKSWPEGKYFGLDHIYDSTHLGYQGPYFSWTPVPDQFSLEAFQKLEHGKKDRDPIMAEIILASSHNPWSPIAHTIDWNDLGDGSIFNKIKKEGTNPTEVWKSAKSVRTEYRKAVQYSVDSLTQWVQRYGDDNTVLVFLGDHQPVPLVTAGSTSRDVPVTIVARDPKVLDRVADWGWTEGLKPAANAPEWSMDKFRDRFMTAYGPGKK